MPKGKGKRHTPEQIVAILRRADSGESVATVCRETNISTATFHRWKSQYGGMELNEMQQLRGLRDENARLKRLVADQALHIGGEHKKMVSPAQKRRAASSVVKQELCSGRQACRYLGLERSTCHYTPLPPTTRTVQLETQTMKLSLAYPRYGYRRVHALLARQGLTCALRTVQRVRRRSGLQVVGPTVRPKCPPRPDAKIKSEGVNDVWCLDLVFDTTQRGTTVKFLTLLDEYSHYALDIVASHRMGSREVVAALQAAVAVHGAPRHLRCDNGGEFIAKHLQTWLKQAGITIRFIEPGSPWQNGVNESFNGRFRDECLNRELLASVLEAQCVARSFRDDYNTSRPHSSIDYRTPENYRAELLRQAPDSGQARQAGPSLRLKLALSPQPTHTLSSNPTTRSVSYREWSKIVSPVSLSRGPFLVKMSRKLSLPIFAYYFLATSCYRPFRRIETLPKPAPARPHWWTRSGSALTKEDWCWAGFRP